MKSSLMNALAANPRCEPGPRKKLGEASGGAIDWIRSAAWRRIGPPFVLNWIEGLQLDVASCDETFEAIFRTGEFEPNEFHWLGEVLKPGMTFVDVGANVGLYSLFAARKVGGQGTVMAIEASSREFRKLERNVALNSLANVRALHMAVSDVSGSRELRVAAEANAGHNTLGRFIYDHTVLVGVETVEGVTLDELVRTQQLDRVDVVKMDIEGGEFAALLGARQTLQKFHPKLLLEISPASLFAQRATPHQVVSLLVGLGYAIAAFDPQTGLPRPSDASPEGDSFNVVASWVKQPARVSEDDAQRCKSCGDLITDYPHDCAAAPEKWAWVPGQGYQPK